MKRRYKQIKLYVKGEFDTWNQALERVFHGYEIKNNKELYRFIEELIKRTDYCDLVPTKIYRTVEGGGYVIRLFKQTENQYGSYVGTVETYLTLDELLSSLKKFNRT